MKYVEPKACFKKSNIKGKHTTEYTVLNQIIYWERAKKKKKERRKVLNGKEKTAPYIISL